MLSIFKKKLFADISGTAEDMPPHVSAVLCLMIEIARMDGKIDDNEIDEIKNFYLDLYPNGNFTEAFEELKDWTSHKESFNPFINIINSNCTKKMKIEILSNNSPFEIFIFILKSCIAWYFNYWTWFFSL